ncbi:MAG: type II secretion system F family protein, partial [Rhodocyclaceae bacterium]
MATAKRDDFLAIYNWEGKDKSGKLIRGELRAASPTVVRTTLRRQGILVTKVAKQSFRRRGGKVSDKDITLFTRQMATMMKSGVPLLQAFDIVAKGASNPALTKLILDIKTEVETGAALNQAFRKHPMHFEPLYCNLIAAGEQAGILDQVLDRLATYKEKTQALIAKIKSALFYPIAVLVVAFIVTAVI